MRTTLFLLRCKNGKARTICAELNKRDEFIAEEVDAKNFQVVVEVLITDQQNLNYWEEVARRLDGVDQVSRAFFT